MFECARVVLSQKTNVGIQARRRLDQLLPVNHFMITFTVPAAFRDFLRSHKLFACTTLCMASSQTLKRLGSESTYFEGNTPGFFGVLHTWGRQMQFHPHIHYIRPGGAFSSKDHSWHPSSQEFYLPDRIMSKIVKSLFFKAMNRANLLHLIPFDAWKQDWNVNSRAAANGVLFNRGSAGHRLPLIPGTRVR